MALERITINISGNGMRRDRMDGREYLVVPTVMLTEGVHNGSQGPLYYGPTELGKTPAAWNMKPIVFDHPTYNGQAISACDPTVIETQGCGVIMNSNYDDKLRCESWLDVEKCEASEDGRRLMSRLEEGETVEVSTGVFVDKEPVNNAGGEDVWEGETYTGIAVNFRPDHLAILLDKTGACSVADGAGLLQLNAEAADLGLNIQALISRALDGVNSIVANALSHSNIFNQLHTAVRERHGGNDDVWVRDVYDAFFVYEEGDKLWRLSYTESDNQVAITGERSEVVQVTEYRTLDGDFVGNSTAKEDNMSKEQTVDALIANESTKFEDGDREFLMGLEEDQLAKLEPVANNTSSGTPEPPTDPAPAANSQPQGDSTPANPRPAANAAEYVAQAPPEIAAVLNHGINSYNNEKATLIQSLTANSNCPFTAQQLEGKDVAELQQLSQLAGMNAPASAAQQPSPSYAGAAGGPVGNQEPANNGAAEEVAMAPPEATFVESN